MNVATGDRIADPMQFEAARQSVRALRPAVDKCVQISYAIVAGAILQFLKHLIDGYSSSFNDDPWSRQFKKLVRQFVLERSCEHIGRIPLHPDQVVIPRDGHPELLEQLSIYGARGIFHFLCKAIVDRDDVDLQPCWARCSAVDTPS
jgi:hypothetical protein